MTYCTWYTVYVYTVYEYSVQYSLVRTLLVVDLFTSVEMALPCLALPWCMHDVVLVVLLCCLTMV